MRRGEREVDGVREKYMKRRGGGGGGGDKEEEEKT